MDGSRHASRRWCSVSS
ncbi:MAG: hypothetical protein IPN42_18815 [Methylococcaceae bacterium]|nr:hypothetical protein [Methylococcaceae bacterium]